MYQWWWGLAFEGLSEGTQAAKLNRLSRLHYQFTAHCALCMQIQLQLQIQILIHIQGKLNRCRASTANLLHTVLRAVYIYICICILVYLPLYLYYCVFELAAERPLPIYRTLQFYSAAYQTRET